MMELVDNGIMVGGINRVGGGVSVMNTDSSKGVLGCSGNVL
jgi:hypothetical protein